MKKQKICIIGGGLTGLVTALALSRLNLKIDLISGDIVQNQRSNRTTAISQDNFNFLKKLEIFKFSKKTFWPCSKMKLYTEEKNKKYSEIFQIKNEKKNVLYMMKNSKIISEMIKSVKKNKMINFKVNKKINKIIDKGVLNSVKMKDNNISNYNLIIICTGYNSQLVRDYFKDKPLHHSYDETSVTTVLEHESTQNNTARQIFLNDEILALLPISNTKTSVVLSMKKKLLKKYMYEKKNFFLKKKIMFYTKDFFKKKKIVNNIEKRDINLLIRKKYIQNRILLFGDALHVVHPLAGQGFNMVLRDLTFLVKIFKNKIELGLDVGSSDILSEFSNKIKPQNFAYSLGIDFIKNIFSIKRSTLKDMRNKIIVRLNRSSFAKDVFFNLANKGFKF